MLKTIIVKRLLLISLIFCLSIACTEKDSGCIYDECDHRRKTVKIANGSKGTMLFFPNPDIWMIESREGIIGSNVPIIDGPDIVVPCNLPEEFKVKGLQVVFSGELKDACDDFNSSLSKFYYSTLVKIETD